MYTTLHTHRHTFTEPRGQFKSNQLFLQISARRFQTSLPLLCLSLPLSLSLSLSTSQSLSLSQEFLAYINEKISHSPLLSLSLSLTLSLSLSLSFSVSLSLSLSLSV